MVFSLSARAEAQSKAIFGKRNNELSRALQHSLIDRAKKLVQNINLPVVWYGEDSQVGSNFGERYANAFQDLFDRGYENVISIGNDCIELTSEILKEACSLLNTQKTVWGPALDGGVYLIGINKSVFDKRVFEDLPWQTPQLLEQIIQKFDDRDKNCLSLPRLIDVDDLSSLKATLYKNTFIEFQIILNEYLSSFVARVRVKNDLIERCYHFISYKLRGPPSFQCI
ncbi:hypothetical protein SAMN06298216_1044 [Spirosomataceae bacterium TFI 002]|nr:hypothetical protein SAMN06298216_1044 [Spirosomataceae bacterium TFI 002]